MTDMDSPPAHSDHAGPISEADGPLEKVHLTRFTVPPDRRSELIRAGRAGAPPGARPEGSTRRLLIELDNGDLLYVSVTSPHLPADDNFPYLDFAGGIVGEEDGVIVAASPLTPPAPEA